MFRPPPIGEIPVLNASPGAEYWGNYCGGWSVSALDGFYAAWNNARAALGAGTAPGRRPIRRQQHVSTTRRRCGNTITGRLQGLKSEYDALTVKESPAPTDR